jgi:hypothetical protein
MAYHECHLRRRLDTIARRVLVDPDPDVMPMRRRGDSLEYHGYGGVPTCQTVE